MAGIDYEPEEGSKQTQPTRSGDLNTDRIYKSVKRTLLELDADEFETLVSYVLRTLGFEATQETGHVGDKGIDFEGELRVMSVASVSLQVQVKRFKSKTIREKQIRDFRGAIKRDSQGCFITLSDFGKKARKTANDSNHVPVNLINGNQFIDIITEQYDELMELMLSEDSDELAEKLQFEKVLIPG